MGTPESMIQEQLIPPHRGIRDPRVLEAMRRVPRPAFVPAPLRDHAFSDRALPIDHDQTISQPFIVAYMTQEAFPQTTDVVLEVGTGSGYQTAVLAELTARVSTIERIRPLSESAQDRLKALNYANIDFRIGSGHEGWPEAGPVDAIRGTCAPASIPEPLPQQLKVGGRLIIPVGTTQQVLYRITRLAEGIRTEALMEVRFVRMRNAG